MLLWYLIFNLIVRKLDLFYNKVIMKLEIIFCYNNDMALSETRQYDLRYLCWFFSVFDWSTNDRDGLFIDYTTTESSPVLY